MFITLKTPNIKQFAVYKAVKVMLFKKDTNRFLTW